jgi:serine/threonine protein kinase
MPPESKPGITADSFLQSIVKSGLLNQPELDTTVQTLPEANRSDPRTLANFLVERGKLSAFQAQKLLKGASGGLILGPYEILAPIGRGGMGTVYLGRNRHTKQLLALKILPPRKAREEERMLARFQREMEISQRVSHPHVALVFETGNTQGVHYIAMEFIPGKTLYRHVCDHGPLIVSRAASMFAEVASGLDHAHRQGVIHRDLKPSNIMITPNGHAKILDLGLALIEGEVSDAVEITGGRGYIVGSMDYIAPEQTRDAFKVDTRADIYGLGCTLFFALTGQPPFPGGTSKEKMQRHRKEAPPSLVKINPKVPADFAQVVDRMMAKDADSRFPTAKSVHAALSRWVDDRAPLPLDRQGDASYEKAVQTLTRARPSTEVIQEAIPVAIPILAPTWMPLFLSRWLGKAEKGEGSYLWLGISVIGFWLLLLLILAVVLIFR